ncbi:MAG: hypothetical protein AAF363_16485 [Bacteroidota bacterium]
MKTIIALLLFVLFTAQTTLSQAQKSLQILFSESIAAYEAEDHTEFLRLTRHANQLRPYHPTITYNLAAAYSLTGKLDSSALWLNEVIKMNSSVDYKADKDFENLLSESSRTESFDTLKSTLKQVVEKSTIYQSVGSPAHIESIAFDEGSDKLFLGSVNDRKILFGDSKTGFKEWVSSVEVPNMYSVMGLEYDESSRSLWACTAALSEMEGYNKSLKGRSTVFQFDIETREIITQAQIQEGNTFGDLFLLANGEVLISDAVKNIIYSLKSGTSEFTIWADLSDEAFNLQGLTINKSKGFLIVSDYLSGLYKMDLKSKELLSINMPDQFSKKGFDGIYLSDNHLLVSQNGTKPMRVIDFVFDQGFGEIISWNVIDQNAKYLNEPTQGFVNDGVFYFISNSQWGNYEDGHFNRKKVKPTMIRKYILEN